MSLLLKILLVYVLLISGISLLLCCYDKAVAKQAGARRVPEKTLLLFAAAGGALVMYVTMRLIRHKTLHKKFMIGLPLLIFLHMGLIVAYFLYF